MPVDAIAVHADEAIGRVEIAGPASELQHRQHVIARADVGLDHRVFGDNGADIIGAFFISHFEQRQAPAAGGIGHRPMRDNAALLKHRLQKVAMRFHELLLLGRHGLEEIRPRRNETAQEILHRTLRAHAMRN
jgi:hypothetical protein